MEIREEDYEVPRSFKEDVSSKLVDSDEPKKAKPPERVIFVDGRVKHLLKREEEPSSKLLISQIVIGAVEYSKKGIELFKEPVLKTIAVVSGRFERESFPEDFIVLPGSGDFSDVVSEKMSQLEMEFSLEILRGTDAVVVKDGSLKPIFLAGGSFAPGKGPIGLVKNVQAYLPRDVEWELIKDLRIGERSKAFTVEWRSDGERVFRVSSYLKIVENGYMRLDAMAKSLKELEDILKIFDSLTSLVPNLTIPINHGRYPFDIAPVQSLEYILGMYFEHPLTVGYWGW